MTEPDGSDYTGPDSEARRFLAELVAILRGHADALVLIGGMAYNFWREPRYTSDLDFVIMAKEATVDDIRNSLAERGFAAVREQVDPVDGTDFLRLVDASGWKIVEFQTAKTDFQELMIERGHEVDDFQPLRIATPEDLIVMKLIAGRSKDYTDVVSLADIEGIDWGYIEDWCRTWDVLDRLQWLRTLLESRP